MAYNFLFLFPKIISHLEMVSKPCPGKSWWYREHFCVKDKKIKNKNKTNHRSRSPWSPSSGGQPSPLPPRGALPARSPRWEGQSGLSSQDPLSHLGGPGLDAGPRKAWTSGEKDLAWGPVACPAVGCCRSQNIGSQRGCLLCRDSLAAALGISWGKAPWQLASPHHLANSHVPFSQAPAGLCFMAGLATAPGKNSVMLFSSYCIYFHHYLSFRINNTHFPCSANNTV